MPAGERAVNVIDAVPEASVVDVALPPPLGKYPIASLPQCTVSPTEGLPSASKNRAVRTIESAAATLTGDRLTRWPLVAAWASGAISAAKKRTASERSIPEDPVRQRIVTHRS